MKIRLPYQDPTSERLLLVALEDPRFFGTKYRHIRATVVRRAVPHKLRKDAPAIYDGTGVEVWNDAHEPHCTGYRVASYVKLPYGKSIYVDDMQLRGQIDTVLQPMRDGKPYGNKISFKPYSVQMDSAKAIFDFFQKLEIFKKQHGINASDDFYTELNHLAQFLKITRVLFFKPGVGFSNLELTGNFFECDIALCEEHINAMLAPFLRTAS